MMLSERRDSLDAPSCPDDRRTAAALLHEAFAEAIIAGVDSRAFAEAAIAIGLEELVARYGEDAVTAFAERLPERLQAGEFSDEVRH